MSRIISALLALFVCTSAYAQNLPAGSIGSVVNPATGQNILYSFSFTAASTGSDYIGFAFRQDPAFWSFTNPVLEVTGTTSNLLTNGNLSAGGPVQVSTNSGTQTIQAPANWGVWYQNGTYPAAAGSWSSGQWYDGAVGSYDGIYQGVSLTAGTSYTITFDALSTSQASSAAAAMIGVYAGTCQSVSLAASACTPNTTSFTPLAVPAQTVNAGNPSAPPVPNPASAPTVVSTAAGTPIVTTANSLGTATTTTSVAYGTATSVPVTTDHPTTYASSYVDHGTNSGGNITVARTTTVVATTPFTTVTTVTTPVYTTTTVTVPHITTTTTVPTTVTTYSDNTTTTTNGTPVVTTSTTNVATSSVATTYNVASTTVNGNIVQSAQNVTSASASATGLSDEMAVRTFNAFLVDPLSTKDGSWITPSYQYAKTNGINRTGGWDMGYQTTVENNTAGVGIRYSRTNSGGYLNSTTQADNYAVNAYLLSKQEDYWLKGSVGFGRSNYTASVSLPTLALYNNTSAKQDNIYADATVYSAATYYGFRPLIGVTVNKSNVSADYTGSSLLNTAPKGNTRVTPTIGARYEITDDVAIEGRVSQSQDFKTVASIRAVAKTQVYDNTYIELSAGADKGSGYTAAVGMVGLRINF